MIISIKNVFKKVLAISLCLIAVFLLAYMLVFNGISDSVAINSQDFTIVLDAGHGGMDGGVEGVTTGVKEAELNLKIVKMLEKYCKSVGFNVVLTRTNEDGLYNVFGRDYKLEDMEKRKDIILKNNANLMVSIHLNSYTDPTLSGAQAHYEQSSQSSKDLADAIQYELKRAFDNAREQSNYGDFYILKCTTNPSVMVECGFLTNAEEEQLLMTKEYQQKMAYTIFCGIMRYFYSV